MDTLGKRLVKIRKERGYTQKGLAELLGITPTRLNYWEKDKREPDIAMIKKISETLAIDSNFLIGLNFWTDDMYEDYRNTKTPAEKFYLLSKHGVPDDLKKDYHHFLNSLNVSENHDFIATEEEEEMIYKIRKLNKLGNSTLSSYLDFLLSSEQYTL